MKRIGALIRAGLGPASVMPNAIKLLRDNGAQVTPHIYIGAFPGFKGVAGAAAELIANYLERAARERAWA